MISLILNHSSGFSICFSKIRKAPPEIKTSTISEASEKLITTTAVKKVKLAKPCRSIKIAIIEITQSRRLIAPRSCIHRIKKSRFRRLPICTRAESSWSCCQSPWSFRTKAAR